MLNRESEHAKARVLPVPRVASILALSKNGVTNENGEDLGRIEDIMVDLESGRISFAVINSATGLFGRESRLFAVPWEALKVSLHDKRFILNISKDAITNAPSFTKNAWPDMSNLSWLREVYAYYGYQPYWND
jgi:sporulation protein YlmC with PRC-barrel domain